MSPLHAFVLLPLFLQASVQEPVKDPVKDKLKRFGLFSQFGEKAFFPTIDVAISSYLKAHPVDWVDDN